MIGAIRRQLSRLNATEGESRTLTARVVQGALSILAGDAYGNVLRLVSNLIMTRLLFPEAFGLMLIVNLVLGALQMLSDMGIRGALITKREGVDETYVNTAWTLSIIRGAALCLVAFLAAWPVAEVYDEPQLFGLILVSAFAPLVQGLCSPFPILEEKKVKLTKVIVWRALSQTVAVALTLGWLLMVPTIWALAAHGVIGALLLTVSSYYFFPNRMPRMAWNQQAAAEIFRFGKWVFVASSLAFLARNANQLVVSKWVAIDVLGVFSIAFSLSKLVEQVAGSMTWKLLLPVYAELNESASDGFKSQRRRIKLWLFGGAMLPVFILAVFGAEIIAFLYDERYHGAGWMLEVMSVGSLFMVLAASVENIPHSQGDSYRTMWIQFCRGVLMFLSMLTGGYYFGFEGLVIGISVGSLAFLPVLTLLIRPYGIHDELIDAGLILGSVGLIVAGWWMFGFPL